MEVFRNADRAGNGEEAIVHLNIHIQFLSVPLM